MSCCEAVLARGQMAHGDLPTVLPWGFSDARNLHSGSVRIFGSAFQMIGSNEAARSATAPAASSSEAAIHEGVLELPGAFKLHFGGQLDGVRVAWRLVGTDGPIVAALGGISAG